MSRDRRLCELMGITGDGYWWCSLCLAEKSPAQVTYEENCTACGRRVEWCENPDFSTPEWRAKLMDFCVEQEWWGKFTKYVFDMWWESAKGSVQRFRGDAYFTRYLWRNLPALVDEYHKEGR